MAGIPKAIVDGIVEASSEVLAGLDDAVKQGVSPDETLTIASVGRLRSALRAYFAKAEKKGGK